MTVWITALADADTRLSEPGLSPAALKDAAEDAKSANDTLGDELRQLRSPETEDGEETHRKIDDFAAFLGEQTALINQVLDANLGLAARVETVAIVVSAAAKTGRSLLDELALYSRGELADAFYDSSQCESLRTRMSDLGPPPSAGG